MENFETKKFAMLFCEAWFIFKKYFAFLLYRTYFSFLKKANLGLSHEDLSKTSKMFQKMYKVKSKPKCSELINQKR
jgi:hypothetical protein